MTLADPTHVRDTAITTSHLSKTFGEGDTAVLALRDVSLAIPKGEFVVMLGPSGSGKTTLLNQIGAIETPTSGSLRVGDLELAGLDDAARTHFRRHQVGFVFQFYNLVPTLTARENVQLIAELGDDHDAADRSEQALAAVGLADRLDRFPGQLSGGEQQRVAIARALVKSPPVLLCDEPTGSLDLETGRSVLELLRSTVAEDDRTTFVVTHNSTIAQMADRVLRLRDGEVVDEAMNEHPLAPAELDW
ncbi:MAG: ABC transporter ATP-binding protein [Acidimicrobiia bacterium]|nr:ABC transporter ATP-binding protein [Acidimicrobiia bacterium]